MLAFLVGEWPIERRPKPGHTHAHSAITVDAGREPLVRHDRLRWETCIFLIFFEDGKRHHLWRWLELGRVHLDTPAIVGREMRLLDHQIRLILRQLRSHACKLRRLEGWGFEAQPPPIGRDGLLCGDRLVENPTKEFHLLGLSWDATRLKDLPMFDDQCCRDRWREHHVCLEQPAHLEQLLLAAVELAARLLAKGVACLHDALREEIGVEHCACDWRTRLADSLCREEVGRDHAYAVPTVPSLLQGWGVRLEEPREQQLESRAIVLRGHKLALEVGRVGGAEDRLLPPWHALLLLSVSTSLLLGRQHACGFGGVGVVVTRGGRGFVHFVIFAFVKDLFRSLLERLALRVRALKRLLKQLGRLCRRPLLVTQRIRNHAVESIDVGHLLLQLFAAHDIELAADCAIAEEGEQSGQNQPGDPDPKHPKRRLLTSDFHARNNRLHRDRGNAWWNPAWRWVWYWHREWRQDTVQWATSSGHCPGSCGATRVAATEPVARPIGDAKRFWAHEIHRRGRPGRSTNDIREHNVESNLVRP